MMLKAALEQAGHGVPVFPVEPASKRPLTTHGFHDASTEPEQVRAWWTRYPAAMIGIPTGSRTQIWVLDIDVDPAKGIDGHGAMTRLEAIHGPVAETLTSITPRGGEHRFFQWKNGIKNSCAKLGPGLDVRGNGGYVVIPPSVRADGTPYRWIGEASHPVAAPQWLLNLANGPPERRERIKPIIDLTRAGYGERFISPRDYVWAHQALEQECAAIAAAPPGTRNHALNRGAFNLFQIVAGGGLSEHEVCEQLFAAAELNGSVADDGAKQAWDTIRSAAGKAQPRYRPR